MRFASLASFFFFASSARALFTDRRRASSGTGGGEPRTSLIPCGNDEVRRQKRRKTRRRREPRQHPTYQRDIPPRRAHRERHQIVDPRLPVYRLSHPTQDLVVGKTEGGHLDTGDRIARGHLEQPPPPGHQRQHPPAVKSRHNHGRRKAVVTQLPQGPQERFQPRLIGLADAISPSFRLALHNPPGIRGKPSAVVAEVEPAVIPTMVGR